MLTDEGGPSQRAEAEPQHQRDDRVGLQARRVRSNGYGKQNLAAKEWWARKTGADETGEARGIECGRII